MKTQVIKINPLDPEKEKIRDAALVLANGGLVAFPTETVYGLGANVNNGRAVERLYEVKIRPKDKPFTVQIAAKEIIDDFSYKVLPFVYRLIDRFWPGPLTLILESRDNNKIGLRMPNNKIALGLLHAAAIPLAVPSANISSHPPSLTANDVLRDLDGKIELIVDGGKVELGIESTVVDVVNLPIRILRNGAIGGDILEKIANSKEILFVCTGNSCRSVMAKYLLEKELKIRKREDIFCASCGIGALGGMEATPFVKSLLNEEGIDSSAHRARRLNEWMLKRADLILAMDSIHKDEINRLYPVLREKVYLLSEFAEGGDSGIYDPIGRPEEEYRKCFLQIKKLIKKAAEKICR